MARNKLKGFSIVELMIAMALTLLLGIGIFQVFSANQSTARLTQALSSVQEVGRLSGELIARDIRNTDYWGCAGDVASVHVGLNPGYDKDAYDFSNRRALSGSDNVAPGTQVDSTYEVVAGTDIIEIRSLIGGGASNDKSMPLTSSALFVDKGTSFKEGQIIAVSDCQASDVFQVTSVHTSGGKDHLNHNGGSGSPGNASNKLSKRYDKGARVMNPSYRTYFISKNADKVPRLMMRDQSGQASEVADWVEDLQFEYGVDTNSDGAVDLFANAKTIKDSTTYSFDDVLSIQATIRVASNMTDVVEKNIAYTWNGGKTLDADTDLGRLRREFTTTASIRSRLP